MANVYDKLKEMNITLPAPPPKGGVYTPVMEFGDHLLYCSGCGPDIGDGHNIVGKVGGDLTLEQGQKAAYNCMLNLLANKELISLPYLALDCGFVVSWVSFLCQDMICKRFGAKASIKISILALLVNLAVSLCFWACSLPPGMWGAYYDTGMIEVNNALNATIGGTWYVVLGSSLAMLVSAVVNSTLNQSLGRMLKKNNFASFAFRSYVSTGVGQFLDDLVFAIVVSHTFFGWTWVQVLMCSLTGAVAELLCEVLLRPVGYRVVRCWERENEGSEYLERHATA